MSAVPGAAMLAAMDLLWRLAYRLAHRVLRLLWAILRPEASGAGVAVWHEGRLLVVETSYRPGLLDLPGGGVERGESPRLAAARELAEETGILVAPASLVAPVVLDFGFEHRRIRATIFTWRPNLRPALRIDHREIVLAAFCTRDELGRARLAPGLRLYLAELSAGSAGQPAAPFREAVG